MPTSRLAPSLLALASLLPAPTAARVDHDEADHGRAAQGPIASLVRDLNASGNAGGGSMPHDFVTLGRRAAFTAFEPSSGWEVWASDGTPEGTQLLADVCPGGCPLSPPRGYVHADEEVLVWWQPTEPGAQLWRTDGTRGGTHALSETGHDPVGLASVYLPGPGLLVYLALTPEGRLELWSSDEALSRSEPVADVAVLAEDASFATEMAAARGRAFFWIPDSAGRPAGALWVSDGTAEGTRQLWVPPAGSEVLVASLAAAGDRGFFVLQVLEGDPVRWRHQLWSSDGTAGGTRPVATLLPPPRLGFYLPPPNLLTFGDRVVFLADDGIHGGELWSSDGTAGGTRRITDLPEPASLASLPRLQPERFADLGGTLLFIDSTLEHGTELWATDGTPESTRMLDVCPGPCSALDQEASAQLIRIGDRAFFVASDGRAEQQLWSSDGTLSGTRRLSGSCPGGCGNVRDLTAVGGQVYVVARGESRGWELWRLEDGEAGIIRRITDFAHPDPFPRLPPSTAGTWLGAAGGRLILPADDGRHGTEPWASAGTPETTRMVADLAAQAPGSLSFDRAEMVDLDGRLLLLADDGTGKKLWTSRGTPATTALIATPSCSAPRGLIAAGGRAFFLCGRTFVDEELWASDGTAAGTFPVLGFDPQAALSSLRMVALGDRLLFYRSAIGDNQIWESDGTAAGTRQLFSVDAGGASSVLFLAALGERLYLVVDDLESGGSLWLSDGTPGDAVELARFAPAHRVLEIAGLGETAVFSVVNVTVGGGELWRTDGTPAGTEPLEDLAGGLLLDLVAFQESLLFLVASPDFERLTLWASDGTAEGTGPLREVGHLAAVRGRITGELVVAGELAFFVARDPVSGTELWSTDGTAEGTSLVRDVLPGDRSSLPHDLAVADGRLFFAATDGVHGFELFTSDGTHDGTRLVHDLAPGPASSAPLSLRQAGRHLYFSADDGLTGREPWGLPLDPGAAGCRATATSVCAGARFRLEVAATDFAGEGWVGRSVPLTTDTGAFWLFERDNLEIAAKVLDGRWLNGHFWVFYGAATNVEYHLTVTDAETGLTRRYYNPPGRFASYGDTFAFGPLGAAFDRFTPPGEGPSVSVAPVSASSTSEPAAKAGHRVACTPGPERLCLQGGRFAVEAGWRDFEGRAGAAAAVPLTGDTGAFWFFTRSNVEMLVKVLDGTAINGRHWVFYGSLTNVEFTLTVTDTQTGRMRTYRNPSKTFASAGDVDAF